MITIEQARKLYTDTDPAHDFDHILRVLKMAERLAEAEGADVDIVRTAALLHDIARPGDDSVAAQVDPQQDHALLAGGEIRRLLADEPPEFVKAVIHAVESHRFRNDIQPRTLEAKILYDADKLDSIGAIGVARAFAYAGVLGNPLWGDVPEGYTPAERGADHTPMHEFQMKLRRVRDTLHTATARRIGAERHRFMTAFFDQMAAEIEGAR